MDKIFTKNFISNYQQGEDCLGSVKSLSSSLLPFGCNFMRIEKNYIVISVNPNYEYDAYVSGIGEPEDKDTLSMWSWINHLREKNWWNQEKEEEFKLLAKKIYGERKIG